MASLYPLRFKPIFRRYIWGGRRLESSLGKDLPKVGDDYAESWEVVDHGDDQSVVANGDLEGWALSRLVNERGKELFGKHYPQRQFPLLFKFLDCQRNLSVQVHPNDAQGAELDPPDLGKTEAWVIVATEPGSCLYAGLKDGVKRETIERELSTGTLEGCLHRIEPSVGDCVFIPAGTVHALAEGLVVAEIQQSSNTTFRLFDWNRVGADGQPRQLHVAQALAVTDFERGPVSAQVPKSTKDPNVERLVACEKFILDRIRLEGVKELGGDDACHIITVLDGQVDIASDNLERGETMLVPASCREVTAESGNVTLLDMYLP